MKLLHGWKQLPIQISKVQTNFPRIMARPQTPPTTVLQQINRFALGWHSTHTAQFFENPTKFQNQFYELQYSVWQHDGEIGLDYE